MKCVICKTGDRVEAKTTLTFDKEGSIIVFKEVPCDKCDQCGEVYLSEKISQQLFKSLDKISSTAGEVSIQKFEAA